MNGRSKQFVQEVRLHGALLLISALRLSRIVLLPAELLMVLPMLPSIQLIIPLRQPRLDTGIIQAVSQPLLTKAVLILCPSVLTQAATIRTMQKHGLTGTMTESSVLIQMKNII